MAQTTFHLCLSIHDTLLRDLLFCLFEAQMLVDWMRWMVEIEISKE